ncbi:MAG: alpha/beta hydrolase [Xenophilus sp.]
MARPGGATLALYEWPAPQAPRGVAQIVHGLGEHAGRYAHVARWLHDLGLAVCAHDHFGHGRSSGPRGGLPHPLRLVEDLGAVVDRTRRRHAGLPLVLLGHSLGGLVASSFVARSAARGAAPVDALALSSPAIDPGLSPLQKLLVAVLSRLAPSLRVGNGLDADSISHDPAVVAAYRADPRVHDRIGARLARFLADEGREVVLAAAPRWPLPTLLLYAGADRLVSPGGSRAFAAAAPAQQVRSLCFEPLYHELLNERDAGPVYAALRQWLDERLGA